MKLSMWAISWATSVKDAPFSGWPDRMENQISIWFNQELWVGV